MKSTEFLEGKIKKGPKKDSGFTINIEDETINNTDYRRVLYTTRNNQLVVMSIPPGEEIGEETHAGAQFIRVDAGQGKSILNGVGNDFSDGDCVVIPAGVRHNIVNTGTEDLKIYTVYSPPQHEDGTVQKTKAEAEGEHE